MIHFVFALALLSPSVKNYTGDTLDFWHVYYNKEKIGEFTETGKDNVIPIVFRSIKKEDSLTIKYFRKTPCANCRYALRIPTDDGIFFIEVSRDTRSVSLSMELIKQLLTGNRMLPINISLQESKVLTPDRLFSLFTLAIK